MNSIPSMENLSISENSEPDWLIDENIRLLEEIQNISENAVADFFGPALFMQTNFTYEQFLPQAYEYQEEAFNMQTLHNGTDLVGGAALHPVYPEVVSIDLQEPLNMLKVYTNNLKEFAAPPELCVQQALNLISSRQFYKLNVEALRLELLEETVGWVGMTDVNALIKGITCISRHLMKHIDNVFPNAGDTFPYEFYQLHKDRHLFMIKIVLDASLPAHRPATIFQPANTHSRVQARDREVNFTQADYCLSF